jgi:hypothetical protein
MVVSTLYYVVVAAYFSISKLTITWFVQSYRITDLIVDFPCFGRPSVMTQF